MNMPAKNGINVYKPVKGAILYVLLLDLKSGKIISCKIYGYDKRGKFILDKGQDFFLENEPNP